MADQVTISELSAAGRDNGWRVIEFPTILTVLLDRRGGSAARGKDEVTWVDEVVLHCAPDTEVPAAMYHCRRPGPGVRDSYTKLTAAKIRSLLASSAR